MKLEGIGPQTKGYLADHGVCPNQEAAFVRGQLSAVRDRCFIIGLATDN
jgi:hypothetical protein